MPQNIEPRGTMAQVFDCGVPLLVSAVRANFTVMSSEIVMLFNLK